MKATELTPGMKIKFTVPGYESIFEIAKVTETRISWYTGFEHKSSWGKNTMKMAWLPIDRFQKGIDEGTRRIT